MNQEGTTRARKKKVLIDKGRSLATHGASKGSWQREKGGALE